MKKSGEYKYYRVVVTFDVDDSDQAELYEKLRSQCQTNGIKITEYVRELLKKDLTVSDKP